MTGAKNMDERVKNFTAYHEYVLTQFPVAPIYQPVTSVGYNSDRLSLPAELNAPSVGAIAIMDMEVKE